MEGEMVNKIRSLFFMVLALPFVVLVRLLRPFIFVRFAPILDRRIGPFVTEMDLYLCEKEAGMHVGKTVDIFYHTHPVSNLQVKLMWDRSPKLRIHNFAYWIDKVNQLLLDADKHRIRFFSEHERDIHNLASGKPPHLSFTHSEEKGGVGALRQMGIPAGADFVCFYARDPAYLNSVLPKFDWQYQDYRDCDIQFQIPAAQEMARRGYFSVRMGAVVKDPLPSVSPGIIDYAVKYRDDFLDIYLLSRCRFLISAAAGLSSVAVAFRRPVAWVNFIPIAHIHSWNPRDLTITKKLWLRREGRFLTFKEIFDSEVGSWLETKNYAESGIDIIENTPEEILSVAIEMDERLKGTWIAQEEDEELQQRFWSLLRPKNLHGRILARMGAEFLRQNRQLLRQGQNTILSLQKI